MQRKYPRPATLIPRCSERSRLVLPKLNLVAVVAAAAAEDVAVFSFLPGILSFDKALIFQFPTDPIGKRHRKKNRRIFCWRPL